MQCPQAKSIAGGLAPPFAGPNAFQHIKAFVEDIFLVSDHELRYFLIACPRKNYS